MSSRTTKPPEQFDSDTTIPRLLTALKDDENTVQTCRAEFAQAQAEADTLIAERDRLNAQRREQDAAFERLQKQLQELTAERDRLYAQLQDTDAKIERTETQLRDKLPYVDDRKAALDKAEACANDIKRILGRFAPQALPNGTATNGTTAPQMPRDAAEIVRQAGTREQRAPRAD